jgi:hypothetical protein
LNALEAFDNFNELNFKISEQEIIKCIKLLKNNKSSSLDNLPNELLKYGHSQLVLCLTKLFNSILSSGTYPKQWAEGYISTLFKSGDPTDPSKYRGLTITSCLGKLFNMTLNNRLDNFLNKHKIIKSEQIGFRKKARTSDHMFVLKTLIQKYTSSNKKLYACFVDFRRAFDSVLHEALLYKLLSLGIGGNFYRTIQSMYSQAMSCVKIGDMHTDMFPARIGVRQGDIMSPNLFKIFINDLPDQFDVVCDPVTIFNKNISCLLYADDVVLLSTSKNGLQTCLDQLHKYCNIWGLTINQKKTKIIIFNKAGRLLNLSFQLGNETLENVRSYKYLGILFSSSGTFSYAKSELYNKGLKAYFKLLKSFGDLAPGISTSLHLFNHTIKPILLYGCEIWGQFSTSHKILSNNSAYILHKLYSKQKSDVLQLKFLKYILGVGKHCADTAVYGELGEVPLYVDIVVHMAKYWHRLHSIDSNSLLYDAYLCDAEMGKDMAQSLDLVMKITLEQTQLLALFQCSLNTKTDHFGKTIKKKLLEFQKIVWRNNLFDDNRCPGKGGNKLRTYRKFKQNHVLESYLHQITNRKERRVLCQLRTSSHKLCIETGRHLRIPECNRTCPMCNHMHIEDELHFTLQCPAYNHLRDVFLINIFNQNLSRCTDEQKFIWLMSCENADVNKQVAKFISAAYEFRLNYSNRTNTSDQL